MQSSWSSPCIPSFVTVAGEALQLNAHWGPRAATAGEVARLALGLQRALAAIDPVFGALATLRDDTLQPLTGGVADEAQMLQALASPDHVYVNPDAADTRFGADSRIQTGFSAPLMTASAAIAEDEFLSVRLTAGIDHFLVPATTA